MCGRYLITSHTEAIRQLFKVDQRPNIAPSYNVAPTQSVPIIRLKEGARELVTARWGLVPFWAKDLKIGYRMINAKAETVADKPAFRDSYKRRRCLVVADGFYEWQKQEGGKQPYLIRLKEDEPFAFAGLWADWTDKQFHTVIHRPWRVHLDRQASLELAVTQVRCYYESYGV